MPHVGFMIYILKIIVSNNHIWTGRDINDDMIFCFFCIKTNNFSFLQNHVSNNIFYRIEHSVSIIPINSINPSNPISPINTIYPINVINILYKIYIANNNARLISF